MTIYLHIEPWPDYDFTAIEAVRLPGGEEGVAILADGEAPPPGARRITRTQYESAKDRIRDTIDGLPPLPDPAQEEIDVVRVFVTADWEGLTQAQRFAGIQRTLKLYGRMLLNLVEDEGR